jgi:hypothetical protein
MEVGMQSRDKVENLSAKVDDFLKLMEEKPFYTAALSDFSAAMKNCAQINKQDYEFLIGVFYNIGQACLKIVSCMSVEPELEKISAAGVVDLKTLSSLYETQKRIETQIANALNVINQELPEVQKTLQNKIQKIKGDQVFFNKLRSVVFLKKNDKQLTSYERLQSAVLRLSNKYKSPLDRALEKQQKFSDDLISYENKCRTKTLLQIDSLRNNIVSAKNITIAPEQFPENSITSMTIKATLTNILEKFESALKEENPEYAALGKILDGISNLVNQKNIQSNLNDLKKEISNIKNNPQLVAPVNGCINTYTNLSNPNIAAVLERNDHFLNKIKSLHEDKNKPISQLQESKNRVFKSLANIANALQKEGPDLLTDSSIIQNEPDKLLNPVQEPISHATTQKPEVVNVEEKYHIDQNEISPPKKDDSMSGHGFSAKADVGLISRLENLTRIIGNILRFFIRRGSS